MRWVQNVLLYEHPLSLNSCSLLNNCIYIRPLIRLKLQEFEATTRGYVIRTKGLLYIAKGAALGSSPSHRRMLFTTICKVPAPGTLKRKQTWALNHWKVIIQTSSAFLFWYSVLECMIYLRWMGNTVSHIITPGLMRLALKRFTTYTGRRMTTLSSEGVFYVWAKSKFWKKISPAHRKKWRPFDSRVSPRRRCVSLCKVLVSAVSGRRAHKRCVASPLIQTHAESSSISSSSSREPCVDGPFRVMLHPGSL